jgi:excisionase family DNA binding protein
MTDRLYTTNQLAALFGVVPTTVIDWVERGKLDAFKTLGGHRRITHQAVLTFLERNRLPYPPAFSAEAPGIALWSPDAGLRVGLEKALHTESPGARIRTYETLPGLLVGSGAEPPRLAILDASPADGSNSATAAVAEAIRTLREVLGPAAPSALVISPDDETDDALRAAGAASCARKGSAIPDLVTACRKVLATR